MNERPRIKLKLTTTDRIFEVLGWAFIIAVWILTITQFKSLPDTIPIHFSGAGHADGFGGKGYIFGLPLVASILFIGLTILNKFPYVFNYPTKITNDNALQQYTNATRMVRYLKCIVVFIFGLIALQTIRYGNGQTKGLGVWFVPLTLGLIFIPFIYFVVVSVKTKKQ
ncbi:MAG TPA: DUF1648 domain-containing protein [Agriterribacter sp.]|nr:DUF1648 domain-containing protein [Chitinophagaceae bacterium]HRP31805.1 DUF1648 domain-containing protein [Agriterribacter sp.]